MDPRTLTGGPGAAVPPSRFGQRRPRGPVETLCDEIGFPFDRRLERRDVFVAFVRALVSEVAEQHAMEGSIAHLTGKPPSEGSAEVLALAMAMLDDPTEQRACAVHDAADRLNPEDAYPTDHTIDLLASCASAIRFGLDDTFGLGSRHAAEAAQHVWKRVYGVTRFDSRTPAWAKDWARQAFQSAILSLLPPADSNASVLKAQLSVGNPATDVPPSTYPVPHKQNYDGKEEV